MSTSVGSRGRGEDNLGPRQYLLTDVTAHVASDAREAPESHHPARTMASAASCALLLLALTGSLAAASASDPRQQTLKLHQPWHSVASFTAYTPTSPTTDAPMPLVLMLSGYCLPGDTQDNVRRPQRGGGRSKNRNSYHGSHRALSRHSSAALTLRTAACAAAADATEVQKPRERDAVRVCAAEVSA